VETLVDGKVDQETSDHKVAKETKAETLVDGKVDQETSDHKAECQAGQE
jgi:hypothetical protein